MLHFLLLASSLLSVIVCSLHAPPDPLDDPIPGKIARGDIVVEAVEFVRAPKTDDPSHPPYTNDAYARVQSLQPVPDGSGRLALSDLRGVLYLAHDLGSPPQVYLDLRAMPVDFHPHAFPNESGLLGFAFHPDFAALGSAGYGKLYTAFSAGPDSGRADYLDESGENQESVIYEWTADDHSADAFSGSWREVLRVGQFGSWHNVGAIAFDSSVERGSDDYGLLYIGFGDGGGRNDPRDHGQNTETPLAAVLRIDPLGGDGERGYGIPPGNPFADGDGGIPEIWAYGLRHPQQFSWDADGRMFLIDIGQDQVEEINLGVAGGNYGWRVREGMFATAHGVDADADGPVYPRPSDERDFIYPVAQYDHDEGFAIGGGFVYRGAAIPELWGKYLFADIVTGRVFYIETDALTPGEPTPIRELRLVLDGKEQPLIKVAGYPNPYTDFKTWRVDARLGVDGAGELYLLTKGDGWVRKLAPVGVPQR